jgi:hypothetical protein
MKTKIISILLVLLFGYSAAEAQYRERRVNFILNVEPCVNWFHADEAHLEKGPLRMGISEGLKLDVRLQKAFAFSVGVNWSQWGGNILYSEPVSFDLESGVQALQAGTTVTYRLQYVEIPFALKVMMPEVGYSTWFFEAGLDPMYNTKALINATDNNIKNEPFQQGINRLNMAWHSGLGLNYSLGGNLSVQFALIYKNTFLDVTRDTPYRQADNTRVNQVGLRLGLVF